MADKELPESSNLNEVVTLQKQLRKWRSAFAIVFVILILLVGGGLLVWKKWPGMFAKLSMLGGGAVVTPIPNTATTTPDIKGNTEQKPTEQLIAVDWNPKWIKLATDECPSGVEFCDIDKYEVGEVTAGALTGKKVHIWVEHGLGDSYSHYIDGQSTNQLGVKLAGIDDVPETLDFLGSTYKLKKAYISRTFDDVEVVRKLFTDPKVGDVYLTKDGCLVVELPNHLALAYDLELPFANPSNDSVDITFNSGKKATDGYQYNRIIGCGALCYLLADTGHSKEVDPAWVVAGKTANGESLYEYKDPNTKYLKDLYNDKNTVAWYSDDYKQLPKSKYTYDQFIATHPILFWQDPLGRWIEFKNKKFIIAAEMCKPVVYLYPEVKTDVLVKAFPNGGITYADPVYGDGWNVTAYPDGKIVNRGDNKTYPYLFWEGIGLKYPLKQEGFVVAKKDLEVFFNRTLPTLGLKDKELADFKEYWVERLSGRDYWKLNFLTKAEFNRIAPLEIAPAPQTAIRVMMTAEGLDKAIRIEEPVLEKAPARIGFTLVEWGGVVLK